MNFEHGMQELHWQHGYLFVRLLVLVRLRTPAIQPASLACNTQRAPAIQPATWHCNTQRCTCRANARNLHRPRCMPPEQGDLFVRLIVLGVCWYGTSAPALDSTSAPGPDGDAGYYGWMPMFAPGLAYAWTRAELHSTGGMRGGKAASPLVMSPPLAHISNRNGDHRLGSAHRRRHWPASAPVVGSCAALLCSGRSRALSAWYSSSSS